ncbi:MAG: LysR substrate-binding domain-containing protein [Pseudomonadota bacterium]
MFDPRTSAAHITLLANDYVERVMLPTLVGTLSSQAPSVRVSVRPVPDEGYQHALADGTADLAIAAAPDPTGRFHYTTLIQDKPVCIARRGHPVVSTRLTLKRFLACQHAHVSSRKRLHGPIDVALAERGQARDVVATASSYNALPDLVAETDLIAVVPERLARAVCRRLPLDSHALPFAVPAFELKLIWGRATDSAALHRWFREQVCNAAGGLSG